MTDKSHVSLLEEHCPICGTPLVTGVLIHKRLQPVLAPKTRGGYADKICESCETQKREGLSPDEPDRIAIVEVDEAKSEKNEQGNIIDPYRLGRIIWLKESAFTRLLDTPVPEKRLATAGPELFDWFDRLAKEASSAADDQPADGGVGGPQDNPEQRS